MLYGMAVQQLAPVSGFVTPSAGAGMEFPGPAEMQNHPLLAGPYHSGATLDLIADSQVGDGDDDIRPDPRPRMKKFMLIVLLIGAVVKYLTSPSYLKLVSEVTDPWAS